MATGGAGDGWFVLFQTATGEQKRGPVTDQQLAAAARAGKIAPHQLISHSAKSKGEWIEAQKIPALSAIFLEQQGSKPVKGELIAKNDPIHQLGNSAPPPPQSPFASGHTQPVVIMTGQQPNAPISAGGWFTRAFAATSGYIIAIAAFTLIPLVIVIFFCCGGMGLFLHSAGEAAKEAAKEMEKQRLKIEEENRKKEAELKKEIEAIEALEKSRQR